MSFTYDPTTDVGTVRLLISDITLLEGGANLPDGRGVFSDEEITRLLATKGGNTYRAAAAALLVIAGNEAMKLKVISSRGLDLDGAALGRELREQAAALREQADDEDADTADDDVFAIVGRRRTFGW